MSKHHHDPTPDDILRDTAELASLLYCVLTGTEVSPLGPMHGTSDPARTKAWDLACASMAHLTEHDPERLLEDEMDRNARTDFCDSWKSRLDAA